ncbi:MAG: DUF401 family protein [Acidaminococcaceae bacterium]
MNIFLTLTLALVIILFLLRRHYAIGPAILCGGFFIWLLQAPNPHYLVTAAYQTATMPRTYDLLFALYFVMCLEIELRTSGTLEGMVSALRRLFTSEKFTLALMPAFLGLLPSLGGARFSAPIVEAVSKDAPISAENKSAINFWFRHVFEFSNPINPGMIMACSIASIPISSLIFQLGWLTPVAFALGWLICLHPLALPSHPSTPSSTREKRKNLADIALSLSPVLINFLLVVFGGMGAATSMGLVAVGMILLLRCTARVVNIKDVFYGALDLKMILNVTCILYFIQLLTVTQVLATIVAAFQSSPLPIPIIIATVSFIIGMLTGLSQGHVAIVLPIVAAMAPGDLTMVGIAMVFGIAGQMLTPTHVCLMVTLDYFKADFFRSLRPIVTTELLLLIIFSLVTYCWY